MIILDTNVLSVLMRSTPEAAVIEWLDRQPAESVWITTVTVFEARLGLVLLPPGKKRRQLETAFERVLEEDLEHRILDFDTAAAQAAAALAAERQRKGRTVDLRDTLIAAVAVARHATVATRNVRHFSDLSVPVVDPWRS
jgi:predicted nucleic acid-binding protein